MVTFVPLTSSQLCGIGFHFFRILLLQLQETTPFPLNYASWLWEKRQGCGWGIWLEGLFLSCSPQCPDGDGRTLISSGERNMASFVPDCIQGAVGLPGRGLLFQSSQLSLLFTLGERKEEGNKGPMCS